MATYGGVEPIAVVGMACRLPGAHNVGEFWRNLCGGVESVVFFNDAELAAAGVEPALFNRPGYVKAKAALADIELFDADFFGLTPREAEILDPQHRLFLECAWEALEAAGCDPDRYPGRIGVFGGAGLSYYLLGNLLPNPALIAAASGLQILLGNDKDFVPTRVSYKLNLRGPSLSINTACSTSLVAIQVACQSLQTFQCDMALAGGVTIHPRQREGYLYQEDGILSPDGHCRAFDRKAQGTVGGNGVGLVALKRLGDALDEGDVVHALIRGWAINNDGSAKVGFSAPSVTGQAEVIAEAQALAGIDPATIGYIEAHGTGTALGDPIEVEALSKVFRARTAKKGFCAIGSVKTNIGHLDTAAGVAGFIKTVLALEHGQLPPSLHFEEPNPRIDFAASPFVVNTRLRAWPAADHPRRAGVSSFGIGGTNAHLVLEEAPPPPPPALAESWRLLALSARTESALERLSANLADHLEQHEELALADVAWTLALGRRAFQHRRIVICQTRMDAIAALRAAPMPRVFTSPYSEPNDGVARLMALGERWLAGERVNWREGFHQEQRRRVELPTYPFERQRFWIDPPAAAAPLAAAPRAELSDWFYRPDWEPAPLAPTAPAPGAHSYLIFCSPRSLGAQLAVRLRDEHSPVVTVEPGAAFAVLGHHAYCLDPREPAHYDALLAALARSGQIPATLVHLWCAEAPNPTPDEAQDRGFYSLLHLAQALGRRDDGTARRIVVVTSGVQSVDTADRLYPERATVLGPVKVIGREYPNLSCRSVDFALSEDGEAMPQQLEQLVAELAAVEPDSAVMAWRGAQRLRQIFTPLRLPPRADIPLRQGGVYLISGGLGGMGLSLADHLARTVQAKLILTRRSAITDPIPQLREWEALGAEVMVASVDVADRQAMQRLVAAAEQRFGRIHGVIHAAGVAGGGVIQRKTRALAAAVLSPKLDGTRALAGLFQDRRLDFMVLCSSLTAILREFGQVDYCAANAFLDAYAESQAGHSTTPVTSIVWDGWQEVGMALANAAQEPEAQRALRIKPAEGADVFARALAAGRPRLVVSTRPLAARIEYNERARVDSPDPPSAPLAVHPRPALNTAYVAPRDAVEQAIADVWQRLLGVAPVGVRDSFFDLGGDSLAGVQVINQINQALACKISVVNLYEGLTIEALAKAIGTPQSSPRPLAIARVEAPTAVRPASAVRLDDDGGIAIIGMVGRFPGAATLEEFWSHLRSGVESITVFSDEELLAAGVDAATLADPRYVKAGPVLEGIDEFDAGFFGYAPREAEIMAPEQRLFLECAWTALEDAGYTPAAHGGAIGVYAGAGLNAYLYHNLYPNGKLALSPGIEKEYLATSVSYKLDLQGPSVNVQTFCSTSLVAVHMAVQGLLHHECDLALAGGAAVKVPQRVGYLYQEGSILSPDGHCRAFDARAQGTVFGSGVGVIVLKRLNQALADGDCIRAVIKGSAINNDGALRASFTAPGVDGQARVITKALVAAGIGAEAIGYVETHGTGTALGDPIEIAALSKAYRASTDQKQFCAIGSLKTNIGHLDAAAGVAGLIKTVLALEHAEIPPSLHFQQANPEIDFAASPFKVNTSLSEWRVNGSPRRAGVSSFGIGGSNAHVIVEEAPARTPMPSTRPCHLLLLSAKSATALAVATTRLGAWLDRHPPCELADVAFTLQVGRHAFDQRRFALCHDLDEARAALADPERLAAGTAASEKALAFLFPGQGAQAIDMGLALYRAEPVFRAELDRCAELLLPHLGFDLRGMLYPSPERAAEAAERLDQTAVTQVAVFTVEYALARLWMAWGVRPQALIGHSIGEYVAACLAGVFTLEDALAVVAARGRLMQSLPAGAMCAVALAASDIQPLLGADLELAAINGPTQCVVSGPAAALAALQSTLERRGVQCRRLRTSHAFHSALMEPILEAFTDQVRAVKLHPPAIPIVSNVSGTWISAAEATDPAYWARHLRQTVRFDEGLQTLLADPRRLLLEVGPGRALSTLALRHPARSSEQLALASLGQPQDPQYETLLASLGRLWLAGVAVDGTGFWAHEARQRVSLPTYPFERQRYWIEAPAAGAAPALDTGPVKAAITDWFYTPSWQRSSPLQPTETAPAVYLLFGDEGDLDTEIARALRHAGHTVITASPGARFARRDAYAYALNPEQESDYQALIDALYASGTPPNRVLHLWLTGAEEGVTAGLARAERYKTLGFYSLLHLAQAWGKQADQRECALFVVTSGLHEVAGSEPLSPEKATVLGPVLVIPHEFPKLSCRCIDIQATMENATIVPQLLAELAVESAAPLVAWRGPHRWLPAFQPCPLVEPAENRLKLRAQGVYLITGGLGGIGLVLAEHLALTLRARLILVGRSTLPHRSEWDSWLDGHAEDDPSSRRIRALRALEAAGAEFMVCAADVTDARAMAAVFAEGQARFGPIHGVIHAAGVAGGGVIQLKTREMAERVMAPKLTGALVLAALSQGLHLDFLLFCSSLNAIVGEFGQVDYTAANAVLDALARDLARKGIPAIGVNWDSWREVGMSVDTKLPASLRAQRAANPLAITPADGVAALRRILGSGLPQVVISTHALDRRIERARRLTVDALQPADLSARTAHPRPDLSSAYVTPRNEVEQAIAEVWQQALGIDRIGIHDNFFEVGGDSLIGLQVMAQLNQKLGVQVTVVKLYEGPTVAALAALFDPQSSPTSEHSSARGKARRQQSIQRQTRRQILGPG